MGLIGGRKVRCQFLGIQCYRVSPQARWKGDCYLAGSLGRATHRLGLCGIPELKEPNQGPFNAMYPFLLTLGGISGGEGLGSNVRPVFVTIEVKKAQIR